MHIARVESKRGVQWVLVGKPLGRTRRRWKDSIEMDLQEVGCGVMIQVRSSYRALANAVMNLRVP